MSDLNFSKLQKLFLEKKYSEIKNVNPIKAKSTNSKNIASIIIDQKNALKDAKDTLYKEANALDKVVNGNGFYFALKDKINRSASQDFRDNIGDTQKALDNLFGEAAQDYFNVIKNSLSSVLNSSFLENTTLPSSNLKLSLSSDFKVPKPDFPLPTL